MSAITLLPDPPTTDDPENFATRADAFLAALPTMVEQINAVLGPTVPAGSAAAGTLTGDTLAANVLLSALTTLGTQAENLVMGGFKLTGLAAGSTAGDSLRYEQRPQFKCGSFTRDTAAASGNQAVTGVGFTPKAVIFFAGIPGGSQRASWGWDTDGAQVGFYITAGGTIFTIVTTSSITLDSSGGALYQGLIDTMDADGFTITWTKTGSPTGTATIGYLALG